MAHAQYTPPYIVRAYCVASLRHYLCVKKRIKCMMDFKIVALLASKKAPGEGLGLGARGWLAQDVVGDGQC